MTLLHTNKAALSRLSMAALYIASPLAARGSKRTVAALLAEGIMQVAIKQ